MLTRPAPDLRDSRANLLRNLCIPWDGTPPGAPKHIKLRWINNLQFEEVVDDSEPKYIDTDD